MRIVICGSGRVGESMAWLLSGEQHDVTVIDSDARLVDRLTGQYDVRGVVGHAGYPSTLQRAGIDDAEVVIAVTPIDEVNMVICQIAHSLFDVPIKIARIRSSEYLNPAWQDMFSRDNLPIDTVISPETEVGEAILRRLETPGAFLSSSFADGAVKLLGLPMEEKSPIRNTVFEQIDSLFNDIEISLIAVSRAGKLSLPKKGDHLRVGDRLYWVLPESGISRLLAIMGISPQKSARRIIIVGGGKVGVHIARELEQQRGFRTSIIENNAQRAEEIATSLNKTIVLQGDALDPDTLAEANTEKADLLLSVTNDDKTNLLVAALAKNMQAHEVMALVNDRDLARLHEQIGVDSIADPKAVTFSRTLLHLRKGRLVGLQSLEDGAAEVVEGVIMETSPLVGKTASRENLPAGTAAGALVRDGKILPLTTRTEVGDHLIVVSDRASTHQLELLFRVSAEFF